MNPMQLFQMIQQSGNPQQFMINMIKQQMPQSPMSNNLINLAQQGNTAEIEQIARNLCKSRGLDYDKEFRAFKEQLGFK